MIKVCHMTSVHDSFDVRIFYKECTSLAKNGYDVYLVAPGESRVENNVKVIGAGEKPNSRLKRILFFTKKVYKTALKIDADIYHFHDPELLPFGMKLKKHGKKVIFDSHELYVDQIKIKPYFNKLMQNLISMLYSWYEQNVLKRIDAVIFPCTIDGKNPFSNKCKNAVIISNAVILSEIYDKYDEKIVKDEDTLCYIGSLTKNRGITNDIIAVSRSNTKLILGGTFSPNEYKNEIENMSEYKNVQYEGYVNRKKLVDILSHVTIGLATYLNIGQYFKGDNFGVKVYEFMTMGIPVILSNTKFNKTMINKYNFGLCVDPNNIDEIVSAINIIKNNKKLAIAMGKNGRELINTKLNWSIEEKKLLDLYCKI